MNLPRIFLLALLAAVIAAAQDTPAPAPAADAAAAQPQSEMQKWIATTDEGWQAVFKRDVTDLHLTELEKLKQQYVAALDAAVTKASTAGDLDGALALRDEEKRFAGTNLLPEQDEATDGATVKQIRVAVRAQIAKLEKENAARTKALHAKYDALLADAQARLTQAQRLDDALLVKAKREQVAAAWVSPLAGGGVVFTPPAVQPNTPPPSKPAVARPVPVAPPVGARVAENMTLYFSGNNYASLVINGKEPQKFGRDGAAKFPCKLREGDIIAVRLGEPLDRNSLWVSCIASGGEFLFETTEQWMGYIPADKENWWNIKNPKEEKPVRFAPDEQQSVGHVKRAAAKTPLYRDAQPVKGEVSDEPKAVFIYHVVTKLDLVPKKPAPVSQAGGAQDGAVAAVKDLVAGSRWVWFDTPDFSGKGYWVEFYKDGSARTSWGQGHTWEILPPNVVHLYQPSDKRSWYLDVDAAKKIGTKNAERDRNHNSMRYEKRVTGTAPTVKSKK